MRACMRVHTCTPILLLVYMCIVCIIRSTFMLCVESERFAFLNRRKQADDLIPHLIILICSNKSWIVIGQIRAQCGFSMPAQLNKPLMKATNNKWRCHAGKYYKILTSVNMCENICTTLFKFHSSDK